MISHRPVVDERREPDYIQAMTASTDIKRKKLRIRAWRRGFKEADLILGRYADANLDAMSDDEVVLFEQLLEQEDQDIYGWIIGREPVPEAFRNGVMTALQAFKVEDDAQYGDGPRI